MSDGRPGWSVTRVVLKLVQGCVRAPVLALLFVVALVPIAPAASADHAVAVDGVHDFGDAGFLGSTAAHFNAPAVAVVATVTGRGYWLVGRDGGVFNFGDAGFFGSTGGLRLNQPIVGMAATRSGRGYWLVASDGGVFAFGDARFFGSMGAIGLDQPVVGMARTASGRGYWLVARDGGIFTFGDAGFFGSAGALKVAQPVVGMAASRADRGYWLVARDGGVFAFGRAPFFGSLGATPLGDERVVGIARTPSAGGYWMAVTFADTGSYPDAKMPCAHPPYSSIGYCTTVNGPYDWGPERDTTPGWTVATTHSPRGYGYRNCTDWVAWRLEQFGVPNVVVRGLGNGGQWAINAVGRPGLTVSGKPRRGDAAVQVGNPGHVAFVEAVYADGAIRVSEYNKSFDGTYDDTRIGSPAQLGFSSFIHFS